jgi:hypothetical protein
MDPGTAMVPPPFDLSKTTKLKNLEFQLAYTQNVRWITTTLQTVKSPNLRQISIRSRKFPVDPIGATILQEWLDLDRLLTQLWTSHPIRPEITCRNGVGHYLRADVVSRLFPELTSRGVVIVARDELSRIGTALLPQST